MAERVGFEPTVPRRRHACFQDRYLQPLGHLSPSIFYFIEKEVLDNLFDCCEVATIFVEYQVSFWGEIPKWLKGTAC